MRPSWPASGTSWAVGLPVTATELNDAGVIPALYRDKKTEGAGCGLSSPPRPAPSRGPDVTDDEIRRAILAMRV